MQGHGKMIILLTIPAQTQSIKNRFNLILIGLGALGYVKVYFACFQGADPPQGDVPSVYWGADWPALSQNWERCQQGLQQHQLPLFLHVVPHVCCPDAHHPNL